MKSEAKKISKTTQDMAETATIKAKEGTQKAYDTVKKVINETTITEDAKNIAHTTKEMAGKVAVKTKEGAEKAYQVTKEAVQDAAKKIEKAIR